MVEAGRHNELQSDLERLKADAESLYANLVAEKDQILADSASLDELAQEVEQAVDRQGESGIIHPLSEKLLQNEGALSEKLASYQNSKLEYQQLVSEIEQIESKIADIQKIERKLEEEHPRK